MPAAWQEALLDEGYADMHEIMQTLQKVGFDGCIIPDHIPRMAEPGPCESLFSLSTVTVQLGTSQVASQRC